MVFRPLVSYFPNNLKANGKLHVTIMDVLTATFEEIDKIKARKVDSSMTLK